MNRGVIEDSPEPQRLRNLINGALVEPSSGLFDSVTSPLGGQVFFESPRSDARDVALAVSAAEDAAEPWRRLPSVVRGRLLHELSLAIRGNRNFLAQLEREDTGKPLELALSEVDNSADFFEFYAGSINLPVGDVIDVASNQHVFTTREPFGVVGVITPWNLPLNQAARACAPALAAGNVVIVKPPETASRTTLELAKLCLSAGIEPGVFNVILGEGAVAGAALVEHDGVRKIAFTGSVEVGRQVGHIAAERIVPVTLELGGKSAILVFADADLELAAREVVRAFTTNAGQVCSAGTRLLAESSIYESLLHRVVELVSNLIPGRDFGPMITASQHAKVLQYFSIAEQEGSVALTGGKSVSATPESGLYILPTVYSGVTADMRIVREEIFGPVLVAMPFVDEEHAIHLANDSEFGLVSGVFTSSVNRALRTSTALKVGQVFVNSWSTGSVQTPFGGHKNSGFGREKGLEALLHYSHSKTVVMVFGN
jgi:aldehyde dehydrogenase (NAD+)